jgi:hypothetical protein
MNCIILIFFSIILPIISLKQIKPKLCIDCKYFISDNNTGKYGKCSFFPTDKSRIHLLVNGVEEQDCYYCSTSRTSSDMCGKEGKHYKKKRVKKEPIN